MQKTAYEMRISDWSSDVCSSDLPWIFLFARPRSRIERWIGFAGCAFGLAGAAYLILDRRAILDQYGSLDGSLWQFVLAGGLILVTLEMARRAVQPVLPGDRKSTRLNSSH